MKQKRSARGPRPRVKINDCMLNAAQETLWRAADLDAGSPNVDVRARAAARLRLLEAQLIRGRMEAQVREGLDETVQLARARHEQVEIAPAGEAQMRIRISSRDGLETLARSGALTPTQFAAGMLYRNLYEAADPERDLRSQLSAPAFLGTGSAQPGTTPSETWAERRVRLSRAIAGVEAKVRVADRNDRAVRALREVAGHARCLSHFVRGGGGQAAHRLALVLALDVVAGHFGLA